MLSHRRLLIPFVAADEPVNLSNSDLILRSPSEARASRRMAASPNLPPWFETARYARLLTMRPSVLNSCQIAKIERFTASFAGANGDLFNGGANLNSSGSKRVRPRHTMCRSQDTDRS